MLHKIRSRRLLRSAAAIVVGLLVVPFGAGVVMADITSISISSAQSPSSVVAGNTATYGVTFSSTQSGMYSYRVIQVDVLVSGSPTAGSLSGLSVSPLDCYSHNGDVTGHEVDAHILTSATLTTSPSYSIRLTLARYSGNACNGTVQQTMTVDTTLTVTLLAADCTSITPYNVTFDGLPHTATGSCLGANGAILTGLVLTGTTHTDAGDYATDAWSFSHAGYASQNGIVHDVIAQATADCTVTPYSVTFDGIAHTATGFCTPLVAVAPIGLDLSGPAAVAALDGLVLSGTTHTDVGDYPEDPWTFSNPNFANPGGTVHDVIAALPTLTITAADKTRVVGAADPAFTYVASAVVVLTTEPTCIASGVTAASPVGTYPITCSGADLAGYSISYVAGTLTITAAPVEIVGGVTATPTAVATQVAAVVATPTAVATQRVAAVVATPAPVVTAPPTSTSGNSSNSGTLPLMLILIALAFSGLGMLAVQAQRSTIRR
jgi:hypothetical protein